MNNNELALVELKREGDIIELFYPEEYNLTNDFKNKIIEQAIDDWKNVRYQNKIDKYNNELTEVEKEFLSDIKNFFNNTKKKINVAIDEAKEKANKYLQDIKSNKNYNIESIVDSVEAESKNIINKFRENLNNANIKEIVKSKRELEDFKEKNGLDRDAHYSDNNLLFFSIMTFILLVETLLNAYFYAKGNDLGLLGGAFTAFIVSGINIIISFIIGYFIVRNLFFLKNMNRLKRLLYLILFLFGIFVISTLHLISAHYREISAHINNLDNTEAVSYVLTHFLNQPFDIKEFDSFILILLGFIISFIAGWKGVTIHDKYPGYMEKWKNYYDKNKKLNDYKLELLKQLNNLRELSYKNIDIIKNNVGIQKQNFEKLRNHVKNNFKSNIENFIKNTEDKAISISRIYRNKYNEKIGKDILLTNEAIINKIKSYLESDELLKQLLLLDKEIDKIYNEYEKKYSLSEKNADKIKNKVNVEIEKLESKNYIDGILADIIDNFETLG